MVKVLIIGKGGREHALGWKIGQSPSVTEVLYVPGNAGTEERKGRNLPLDGTDPKNFDSLADLIEAEDINLTVVGPEGPLDKGIIDHLNGRRITRVFGPTKEAALLETDKFFSYELMKALGIPQANSILCHTTREAQHAIRQLATERGVVIKARGLTGGKGVTVCDNLEQALAEITQHAQTYGPEVLIAERLFGQEFSVFGLSDGERVYPIEISIQDHKPLLDNDLGPNTGGMGAYGPAPIADAAMVRYIADEIMTPIVQRMKRDGKTYKGFLYAGMITSCGGPKVLEFNIRFGDPECQPAMMMIQSDFYEALSLALDGQLDQIRMEFKPGAACCVVLAAQGYPGDYRKGAPIFGLREANQMDGVHVFHAGTKRQGATIVTDGGRVLGVGGHSPEGIAKAQAVTYQAVRKIIEETGEGVFHYRKDIAAKALKK